MAAGVVFHAWEVGNMDHDVSTLKPEKSFRIGAVRASIWKNIRQNKDGKTFETRTVTLDRSYKDKEGNYKSTHRFTANEVPKAILLLQRSYEYLIVAPEEEGEDTGA
jgi:hypothetical protein